MHGAGCSTFSKIYIPYCRIFVRDVARQYKELDISLRFVVAPFSRRDEFIVIRPIKLDIKDVRQFIVQRFVSLRLLGLWSEPKRIFDFQFEK